MLELLADPNAWAALVTLTVLEIVLGIDNVVFISVLISRLPEHEAKRARQIGLGLALIFRLILLAALSWLIGLTQPVFSMSIMEITWRDIILIGGGMFLIAKATHEIHREVEASHGETTQPKIPNAFFWVLIQLIAVDMIFSLDSIITAIGMAEDLEVMVAAVIIAMLVMYIS